MMKYKEGVFKSIFRLPTVVCMSLAHAVTLRYNTCLQETTATVYLLIDKDNFSL